MSDWLLGLIHAERCHENGDVNCKQEAEFWMNHDGHPSDFDDGVLAFYDEDYQARRKAVLP